MTLKLIEILKMPKYSAIAALSAIIFAFVYMYAQVLGNIDNIIIWIQLIPWYNVVFFIMLAAVFGITMSFQIYTWNILDLLKYMKRYQKRLEDWLKCLFFLNL